MSGKFLTSVMGLMLSFKQAIRLRYVVQRADVEEDVVSREPRHPVVRVSSTFKPRRNRINQYFNPLDLSAAKLEETSNLLVAYVGYSDS